jgi:succinylglutamate desuccinylase
MENIESLNLGALSKNPIVELSSSIAWKITTIMVWVHWNEIAWIEALKELLPILRITSWKVYFITANLEAIKLQKRFFEKNLNRCFLADNNGITSEDKRAREIIPYLVESDYLLDVHNTLNTENSVPFLISEHKDLWKYFDVEVVVTWFDKLHPWWSDGFMNSIWKIGLCLESGSIYDEEWAKIAKNGILNFLRFTWNIAWNADVTKKRQIFIRFNEIYKNRTADFRLAKQFLDFEKVSKWQILAYDWEEVIYSDRDWYIVFAYETNIVWSECFCLGVNK